jgi:hypothetical protein
MVFTPRVCVKLRRADQLSLAVVYQLSSVDQLSSADHLNQEQTQY